MASAFCYRTGLRVRAAGTTDGARSRADCGPNAWLRIKTYLL